MAIQTNQYIPGITNQQTIPQVIPQVQPQYQYQQQQSNMPTVGVYWVQGLEGAKGYQVNIPNTEVYLRDVEENNTIYIKTTDSMGRPTSLKRYRLEEDPIQELQPQSIDTSNFVTKDELEEMFQKYMPQNKPRNRNHNKGGGNNAQ